MTHARTVTIKTVARTFYQRMLSYRDDILFYSFQPNNLTFSTAHYILPTLCQALVVRSHKAAGPNMGGAASAYLASVSCHAPRLGIGSIEELRLDVLCIECIESIQCPYSVPSHCHGIPKLLPNTPPATVTAVTSVTNVTH